MTDVHRPIRTLLLMPVLASLATAIPARVHAQSPSYAPTSTSIPAPAPAAAQTQAQDELSETAPITAAAFSKLQRDSASELSVYSPDSDEPTHGLLLRLSPRDLTMLVDGEEKTIPMAAVRRIDRRGDTIWDGFAAGGAVGLITAVTVSGGAGPREGLAWAIGIPALIGAGIDSSWVGETTIYRSPQFPRAPGHRAMSVEARPATRRCASCSHGDSDAARLATDSRAHRPTSQTSHRHRRQTTASA
jgi:hypothetical protein